MENPAQACCAPRYPTAQGGVRPRCRTESWVTRGIGVYGYDVMLHAMHDNHARAGDGRQSTPARARSSTRTRALASRSEEVRLVRQHPRSLSDLPRLENMPVHQVRATRLGGSVAARFHLAAEKWNSDKTIVVAVALEPGYLGRPQRLPALK
jgi:hypothetical protein